ncbi:MAG: cyclic nucleotide-binding domain-containing protein [Acidimicrobiales bacterium]
MSDSGAPDLRAEISEASGTTSSWSGPNERTAFVDAALVRIIRALDAVALHHEGRRPKRVELVVESSASSTLEVEVGNDGRWQLEEGSWVDEGRVQRSKQLRPVIRGVARASRPAFREALDTLVRDVEIAAAARIAIDSEGEPAAAPVAGQSVDQLLEATFSGLSDDDRAALRAATSPLDLGAGTTLFVEGTSGDEMLFLLGGTVAVETRSGLVRLGPGSVVGERAPLSGKPRDATVRAITDVVVLVLHAASVAALPDSVRDALGSKVVF